MTFRVAPCLVWGNACASDKIMKSSLLKSSFVGGHNQGLTADPWPCRVLDQRGLTSLIRVLPLGLDLIGTLVRVSLKLSSATYTSFQSPRYYLGFCASFCHSRHLVVCARWSLSTLRLHNVDYLRPWVCWNRQLSVMVCQNNPLPTHRFAGNPCGGVPELVAPKPQVWLNR
jgi:hypothetical protein